MAKYRQGDEVYLKPWEQVYNEHPTLDPFWKDMYQKYENVPLTIMSIKTSEVYTIYSFFSCSIAVAEFCIADTVSEEIDEKEILDLLLL
jgi:hypothetical protein